MNAELPLPHSASVSSAVPATRGAAPVPSWMRRVMQQFVQFVAVVTVAFLSYFIVSHFVLQSVQVVGASMQPTLHNSERYLLNRWVYYFRAPRAGDIVVLKDPGDHGFSVKRVIATEGHTLALGDGAVQLDGSVLKEPYLAPATKTFPDGPARQQVLKCGKDQYVVLGDNRMNSADSRVYGPVPRSNIMGLIIR